MPTYSDSKIYKISGNDKTYIGSTTQKYISTRFAQHKLAYRYYLDNKHHYITSFEVMSDPNCEIELLETIDANCYKDVANREAHFIKELDCVNHNIPNRTIKEYYLDNSEKYKYNYKNNKEAKRKYYLANRDKKLEYQKQRYNKLKIIKANI